MQALQVYARSRDESGALDVRTTESPGPAAGEARVRVEAAGVSYGDLLQQRGVIPGGPKPPFVPGFDVVGTVESVGDGVTGLAAGMRVAALIRVGGYSSVLNVPAARLVPVPANVSSVDVAAVALNYFIAQQMVHRVAGITTGDRVLIHGASGGVGVAFLQLTALIGDLTIWGTASGANAGLLSAYGAVPIDYRSQDFVKIIKAAGAGLQAVFDPIGGTHFRRSYSLLARGGTLVAYGQNDALRDGRRNMGIGAVGFLGGIVAPKLVPDGRRTTFYNAWALEKSHPAAYREDMTRVLELLSAGKIAPSTVTELPLAEAERAFEILRGGARGKIVLTS